MWNKQTHIAKCNKNDNDNKVSEVHIRKKTLHTKGKVNKRDNNKEQE